KTQIGGERLELTVAPHSGLDAALQVIRPYSSGEIQIDRERRHLAVPVTNGAELLAAIVRELHGAQIALSDLALRRPTLDDVFLSLTRRAVGAGSEAELPEEALLQKTRQRSRR